MIHWIASATNDEPDVQKTGAAVKIVVVYPKSYDTRKPEEIEQGMADLKALVPGAEVAWADYNEPPDLRALRGHPPYDEARAKAPALTGEQRALFAEAEAMLCLDLPFDMDQLAPKLKWVQSIGAGVAQLQSAGLEINNVRLTNAVGVASTPIAEFAMARILESWKRFPELDRMQAERGWKPLYGKSLTGCTIGIVGYGAIGQAVAARAKPWGMRVLATKRNPTGSDPNVDRFFGYGDLHALLKECDAVVLSAPETAETHNMFNQAAFAAMKPGSFLVNVARGTLVDQAALKEALVSGHLSGAATDVAIPEPLPPDDPLWTAPNLKISPHCSVSVDKYFHLTWDLFLRNLKRYLAGEELINPVSNKYVG